MLDRFDKATPDSSNALLKFLEEPGTSLFGILLVENAANTLTTIQSRCQLIQFRPGSIAYVKNALKDLTDEESADMLARAGYSFEEAAALVTDETYPLIREEAKVFLKTCTGSQPYIVCSGKSSRPKGNIRQSSGSMYGSYGFCTILNIPDDRMCVLNRKWLLPRS